MSDQKTHKVKDIFVEGAIPPSFIAESIAKHATRTDIGAHEIFLGQVRADTVGADDRPPASVAGTGDGSIAPTVSAIEYTAYRDMANEQMIAIREEAQTDPAKLKGAPYTLPVRRLDDVRAAKQLDLAWKGA